MKQTTLAYVAGIIDGEGCIFVTKDRDTRHYLRVTVTNTCELICFWLEKQFSGSYSSKLVYQGRHRPCFVWTITGQKAQRMLKFILPYLFTKKEQAEVALTFPIKPNGIHCTQEEKESREKIYCKLQELKHYEITADCSVSSGCCYPST